MSAIDQEMWRPVPGFPGYDVSDQGRIRSYYKHAKGRSGRWTISNTPQRILKGSIDKLGGYHFVILRQQGANCNKRAHNLVASAFLGPCPSGLEVCHNDGIKTNNRAINLRYDTHLANMQEAIQQGAFPRALTPKQVQEIRSEARRGISDRELAKRFDVSRQIIGNARAGRNYRDVVSSPVPKDQKPAAKLTPAQVVEIYRAATSGVPPRDLQSRYNISLSTISRIKLGSRWADVTAPLHDAVTETITIASLMPAGGGLAQKGDGDGMS